MSEVLLPRGNWKPVADTDDRPDKRVLWVENTSSEPITILGLMDPTIPLEPLRVQPGDTAYFADEP